MRRATVLGGLASVNILIGFAANWYTVTTLGPGPQTDALFAGVTVPSLILLIFSNSLTYVLVPILATEHEESFQESAWTFFTAVGLFYLGVGLLLSLSAPVWVPWTVPGFETGTQQLTVSLARVQLLSMVGTALSLVMYAAHHARQRFVVVEWSATIAGVAALAFLVWGLPRMGVHAAAWATVVRAGIQMVYLMPALGRFHLPNFQSPSIQVALKRIRPLVLGTSYYKTDLLVDRFLASLAPAGGLSLLHLAQQMYGAGQQVLNKALSNPIVPVLSRKARNEEWELHGQITTHRILWMMGATGLVVLVLWAVGRPVLDGVFGHGNFDPPAIQDLWGLMLFLGPALIARSAGQILTTSFYSMGNTLTPTVVGSLGYTLGIVLRIALFYKYGLFGLAVAISLQAVLNNSALAVLLFKPRRWTKAGY